jgi:hypothetical protein
MPPHSIFKEPLPQQDDSDESSPPTRRRQRSEHNVTITDEVHVQNIPCRADLSEEDKIGVWYTVQEIQRSLNECKETVIAMQSGVPMMDSDSEVTSRGLEYMTVDGFDITTSSLGAVKILLEEQERQRSEGVFEADMLACSVGGISKHRLRIAHLAGMKDARAVYGDGNFKSDGNARGVGDKSKSFSEKSKREPRSRGVARNGSTGAIMEQTRRRRGSRGPLRERVARTRSGPDVSSSTAVEN